MTIKELKAEEIFNAQGFATLQCTLKLANNNIIKSSIPSGFNPPSLAVRYAYDDERLLGKGMQQAADYINNTIAPKFIDKPLNALAMDSELMDLDATPQKTIVGGNVTLVISLALFKAQAASESIELFELLQSLSGTKEIKIPQPIFSIVQGTKHIKEFLLIGQEKTCTENIQAAALFHHHMHKLLQAKQLSTSVSSYGSFAPQLNDQETLQLIEDVLKTLPDYTYQLGLVFNADEMYDAQTRLYNFDNQTIVAHELIQEYQKLITKHPYITYIQDGLASSDHKNWKSLTTTLDQTTIAGDQIFASNAMSIRKGILQGTGNNVIIRPEYVGTVSQALAAIDACRNNDRSFTVASDLGQTCETFCADLALATGATYFKSGGMCRGEFTSKYNRLMNLEQKLFS